MCLTVSAGWGPGWDWTGEPVLVLPEYGLGVSYVVASWGHADGVAVIAWAQSGKLPGGHWAGKSLVGGTGGGGAWLGGLPGGHQPGPH